MRRNWRHAFTASTLGLAHLARASLAQTPPLPPALPDPPGANAALPANLSIDIQTALASQPTSGPQGVPINLAAALRLAGVSPLDIAAATARLEQALGLLIQAKALK